MTGILTPVKGEVLIVVDLQRDFCPGGSLAVPDGDSIVAPINHLARHFTHVILTQDWHPCDHTSFATSHPGQQVYDVVMMPYGPQTLWPAHCIQGSTGAEFHPELDIPHATAIIRKGTDRNIDSYSTFYENDRTTPTGLVGYLRERGLTRIVLAGLALDFCIRYSAEDASAHGLEVSVVRDCCRPIDVNGSRLEAEASFRRIGASMRSSEDFF